MSKDPPSAPSVEQLKSTPKIKFILIFILYVLRYVFA